ncbi:MAG: hypothetical protein ACLFQV_11905 [Vulcanimicrobiota bacterium]
MNSTDIPKGGYVSLKKAAAYLGVSYDWLYSNHGFFNIRKINLKPPWGTNNRWRFKLEDLEQAFPKGKVWKK